MLEVITAENFLYAWLSWFWKRLKILWSNKARIYKINKLKIQPGIGLAKVSNFG